MKVKDNALWFSKWIGAGVLAIWAEVPQTVVMLLIFMGLDIITGYLRAFIQRTVSSEASFRGIAKKMQMLLLLAGAHFAGQYVNLPVDLDGICALAFIANEFISIVENVGQSGVNIPPQLVDMLKRFQKLQKGDAAAEVPKP